MSEEIARGLQRGVRRASLSPRRRRRWCTRCDDIGGDEARVARARGSGRGALPNTILANGTPLSRVSPPRAGWAVRINEATLTTPTQSTTNHHHQQQQQQQQQQQHHTPDTSRAIEQWASERASSSSALSVRGSTSPSSPSSPPTRRAGTGSAGRVFSSSNRVGGASTTPGRAREGDRGGRGGEGATGGGTATGVHFPKHWQEEEELEAKKKVEHRNRLVDAVACYQAEHLGLRSGRPMSQNNAIPPLSRPPSSQANAINAGNGLDSHLATNADTANNNADDLDAHISTGRTVQQIVQPVRVHDHNRPFPPPRLPTNATSNITGTGNVSSTNVPSSNPRITVTVPLSPLANTFRSRPRNADTSNETTVTATATTTTTTTTTTPSPRGPLLSSNANDTPPRSPIGEVSLSVPRPDGERTINEYVEAPFKHCCLNQERRRLDDEKRLATGDCPKIERRHQRQKGLVGSDGLVAGTHHRLQSIRNLQAFRGGSNVGSGANATTGASTANTGPIGNNTVTKQPVSFTKEPANSLVSRTYDPAGLSIMCNFCGRCRCESCREPPPLPSKWLCDNKCFCSADTILDYASCLCCVKGLFYHCVDGSGPGGIDGDAAGSCADEPCSCTGNKKISRWACLGALTLLMPCLLCYWPFKGCVALCELCYARHAAQGCRCNPNNQGNSAATGRHHPIASDIGDSRDPEKRLLDPVTPEL